MLEQVHDSSAVLRQLSNEAGITNENTLRELTIGDYIRVYPRRYVHFGLPVRNFRESIRGSFAETGEMWCKRLSADSRLKGIFQFELRYGSVEEPTDSCLSGNSKTIEIVPQYLFRKGFLTLNRNVKYPGGEIPKIWNGYFDCMGYSDG